MLAELAEIILCQLKMPQLKGKMSNTSLRIIFPKQGGGGRPPQFRQKRLLKQIGQRKLKPLCRHKSQGDSSYQLVHCCTCLSVGMINTKNH